MKKITLVRLDGDAKHEVDIPVGDTIIGRGPVMQCTDKRVSRTHAQIKVSEDGKIELQSMSLNPCYYNDKKVITKSSSVELRIGDRFSFLPDSYCYCLKAGSEEGACSSDCINNVVGTDEEPVKVEENGVQSVNPDAVHTVTVTLAADDSGGEMSAVLAGVGSTTDLSGEMTDPDVPSESIKNGSADTSPSSANKSVPMWLLVAAKRAKRRGEEPSGEETDTKKAKAEEVAGGEEAAEEVGPARVDDTCARKDGRGSDTGDPRGVASISAAHQMSDDSESEAPARAEPSEEAAGQSRSPAPAARPSGSAEQKAPNEEGEGDTTELTRDRSPPPTSSRESCKYGTDCYRKNPQHLAEFSHPGNPDYKEDDRPECPYGTNCYRKNPLHRQNYKHPKKPQKQPKKRQRVKKDAPKDADESSDEDDYVYDDPFLNDASSDDYEPSDSGSDASASEGEEEEDMKRMKKEAKRFVRGKQKH